MTGRTVHLSQSVRPICRCHCELFSRVLLLENWTRQTASGVSVSLKKKKIRFHPPKKQFKSNEQIKRPEKAKKKKKDVKAARVKRDVFEWKKEKKVQIISFALNEARHAAQINRSCTDEIKGHHESIHARRVFMEIRVSELDWSRQAGHFLFAPNHPGSGHSNHGRIPH